MRSLVILSLVTLGMVGSGCSSESTDTTTGPAVASTTTTTAVTTTTIDPVTAETDRIIQAWIDGWLADDPEAVLVLYGDDSIYADIGCPFEMVGKSAIRGMVSGHMMHTDYTKSDPVQLTYTDSGAVVQWVWAGTQRGEEFTMDASTTFEIEDGVIVKSTDSYERSDAPPGWEQDCIENNAEN